MSCSRSRGRAKREFLRAVKSRALPWFMAMRLARRSRSKTPFKSSRAKLRRVMCSLASETASKRASMASAMRSGERTHSLKRRPPMAVTVLSMVPTRVPLRDPSLKLAMSSKFLKLESSMTR